MSEPRTALGALWDAMWEDLRHNATGRPSGLAIIARHRPAIEAEAAELDVERLARAIHSECERHWREIAEADPTRHVTQHLADAHDRYAEAIAAGYAKP